MYCVEFLFNKYIKCFRISEKHEDTQSKNKSIDTTQNYQGNKTKKLSSERPSNCESSQSVSLSNSNDKNHKIQNKMSENEWVF